MPAESKEPKAHYLNGNMRKMIVMSPQAIADAATVCQITGELYLSKAIAHALRRMVEEAEEAKGN